MGCDVKIIGDALCEAQGDPVEEIVSIVHPCPRTHLTTWRA